LTSKLSQNGKLALKDNLAILNGIYWIMRTGAPAQLVPTIPSLPQTVPEMGQNRHVWDHSQETGTRCERTRWFRFDRVFHRWHLCHG